MNKLKYVIPLIVVILTGCFDSTKSVRVNNQPLSNVDSISELCLDNVSYYFYTVGGKAGLAVRIDPQTLSPVNCR